ncbi:MAG TPA: LPS assembly protein LptD [Stellaceae bacterium]|nr:LPS assembly protein LptD [Stellaceae bacterium]
MRGGAAFWVGALLAAAPVLPMTALARAPAGQQQQPPVLFSADEVQYDSQLGLIVAKGNVQLTQRDQILLADTVTYNERTDTATASGHVSLLQPTGDIIFADYMELHDDMRDGFLQNVRMLLSDQSRMAGNTARRINGNRLEIRRGVYSPCDSCREDPTRPPIWQIRAEKIIHDKEEQIIEYRDAEMDIDGIPVLWTPYFSHPDPSVKRRSGFLEPSFGDSTSNGFHFGIPYYWTLGPDKDATLSPVFTTAGGTFLGGQYRQRFGDGKWTTDASVTVDSKRFTNVDPEPVSGTRWHVNTSGEFDVDQNWRLGFDALRASDPTYLLRYHLPSPLNFLTSHAFAENYGPRSYGNISAWSFQSLQTGVGDSTQPIVAPVADYQWVSQPDAIGSRLALEGNVMNLARLEGIDTRRTSLGAEWRLPFVDSIGGQYGLAVHVRGDGYQSDNLPLANGGTESATAGRVFPQLSLTWRYPWVRRAEGYSQIIEPIAMIAAAPNGGNPATIPNEDSQGFEFDATSLFLPNRFPGFDRVDSGQRVDYGLQTGVYGDGGGSTRLLIGQSYALQTNDNFLPGSGLEHRVSDVVGSLTMSPTSLLDLTYGFRLGYNNLALRSQEVGTTFGPTNLRFSVNYLQIDQIADAPSLQKRKQISGVISAGLTQYWSMQLIGTRDLAGPQNNTVDQLVGTTQSIYSGVSLTYRDECMAFVTSLTQSGVRSGDAIPGTSLLVSIVFKNLGDVGTKLLTFGGL